MSAENPDLPGSPRANRTNLRRSGDIPTTSIRTSGVSTARGLRTHGLDAGASISPADFLRGVRRRLPIALTLGLILGGIASVIAWSVLPSSKYTTGSLLSVSAAPQKIVFQTVDNNLGFGNEFATYQQTQETLIRSRFVLGAALRQPGISVLPSVLNQPDPIAWLAQDLRVSYTGEAMQIGMEGERPKDIVLLVNAVTDAYMNEVVNVEHDKRKERYDKLKVLHDDYQKRLQRQRDDLRKIAESAGSNDKETLAFKQQLSIEHLALAERTLAQIEDDIRHTRLDLAVLEGTSSPGVAPASGGSSPLASSAAAPPVASPSSFQYDQDTVIREYKAQIGKLNESLAHFSYLSRSKSDPSIRGARQKIEAIEGQIASRRAEIRKELLDAPQGESRPSIGAGNTVATPSGQPAGRGQVALARRLQFLDREKQEMADKIEELQKGARTFNKTTLNLESLQDEIHHMELAADKIGQEAESLRVELDAPSRIRLIEKAEVPMPVSSKKRIVGIVFSGLGSLGLVLCGFGLWDARMRRIDSVDKVITGLGIDVVGMLPSPRATRSATRSTALSKASSGPWEQYLMESIDVMRTILLHASRVESIRTLLVTSAVKGEGKTSLTCHLGVSLSRAQQRTLIIDCDLRRSSVHKVLDMPSAPGVCEFLRGEAPLASVIQSTPVSGLAVITAGRCDFAAIQTLARGRFQDLLDQVRDQYDFILIDSAPILPLADTLQVCQHVDAAVFSILRDTSRLPQVQAAYERIAKLGVRILGAAVAGTEPTDYGYSYNDSPDSAVAPAGRSSSNG